MAQHALHGQIKSLRQTTEVEAEKTRKFLGGKLDSMDRKLDTLDSIDEKLDRLVAIAEQFLESRDSGEDWKDR